MSVVRPRPQSHHNRQLIERARARYYCSETKSFKRHMPVAESQVTFNESEPLRPTTPSKKKVLTQPSQIVGPTMETVEQPKIRSPKKYSPAASNVKLTDNHPVDPVVHHKKQVAIPTRSERPSTPQRKQVPSNKRETLSLSGSSSGPVRHAKKFVPAPSDSPERPATPHRRVAAPVKESIDFTHTSPADPRHFHRRPASASSISSSSTIALSDANALQASPIKSVSAHLNGRRSNTPTRSRPPADSRAAASTLSLARGSTDNSSSAQVAEDRPAKKKVTKESLAAMYKPEPRPVRAARRPPSPGVGGGSSSFSTYSLADIIDACDNTIPHNVSKRMMADRPKTSSVGVTATVFRSDQPNPLPEKPQVPAKRQIRKNGESSFVFG